jgi:hypothetical protein
MSLESLTMGRSDKQATGCAWPVPRKRAVQQPAASRVMAAKQQGSKVEKFLRERERGRQQEKCT